MMIPTKPLPQDPNRLAAEVCRLSTSQESTNTTVSTSDSVTCPNHKDGD
jgi:hypothetical protein